MDQSNFKGYPSPPCALTQPVQELSLPGASNRKAGGKASSKTNDGAGSVPEFIQKLFRMLENKAFKSTFCWGTDGTTFIVKDTNEFSKTILPKHFKHCNFASFVRQLNKYDFHKVRNADDGQRPYGDQAWEFVHPKFMRDRKDLLEEIRRKTPGKTTKKEATPQQLLPAATSNWNEESAMLGGGGSEKGGSMESDLHIEEMRKVTQNLQQQIKELQKSRIDMEDYLNQLSNTNCLILQELVDLGKQMQIKDNLIQDMLKNTMAHDRGEQSMTTQTLLDAFATVSRANSEQLERITRQLKSQQSHHQSNIVSKPNVDHQHTITTTNHAASSTTTQQASPYTTATLSGVTPPVPSSSSTTTTPDSTFTPIIIPTQQPHLNNVTASAAAAAASMNAGSLIGSPLKTGDGVTFVTLGRLSSNTTVRDNKPAFEITPPESTLQQCNMQQHQHQQSSSIGLTDIAHSSSSNNRPTIASTEETHGSDNAAMSLKRKMNIAGWTVPPRVLLVDDDSVYRDLSGKLLQVIGCSIDLAKDGVEALRKMGLEKYDLILMDIVMPNLDGISATRNIRQYDALTPIISMTSNFTDNDIMQYIGSGMTDILPKPFSKKTLYSMLEKYCAHLKAIQRVHRVQSTEQTVPRPIGMLSLPPPPPPDQVDSSTPSSSSTSSPSSTPSVKTTSATTTNVNLVPQTNSEDPDTQMQQVESHINSSSPSASIEGTTNSTNTFAISQPPPYSFPMVLESLSNTGLTLQQHSYSTSISNNNNTSTFYSTSNAEL
ncbi:hypothetical protein BC941DRAFT_475995 [Chlamydoabsidia padenii]|nr:hypothetical protein BC941DRAFT_475995 [Chlamydoabsidia padenii]